MEESVALVFEQIGKQSKDVYFIFDVKQSVLKYLNPAYESVWGAPLQQVSVDPVSVINTIHPEDRQHTTDHFLDCLDNHIAATFEFRIICPDQLEKHIKAKIYPFLAQGEILYISGIAEDISLVKNNIFYSEKINARKNTMLDILAHDLKGPISVINMMASGIQREREVAQNESVLKSVKYIQELCKRNIALIRDLMNQEFLESTEVELRKERADLVWEINDVINHYNKSADALSRKFVITSSSEKIWVQIDSLKLMQVINNLI
jgi:two-component system sensor histidine kinase VicK